MVGQKRIELAKILTDLTGFEYKPENIKQANGTVGNRSKTWHDAFYWSAMSTATGAVIASRYTMTEIINAKQQGREVYIRLDELCIKDSSPIEGLKGEI
jgi:hypothetical protein